MWTDPAQMTFGNYFSFILNAVFLPLYGYFTYSAWISHYRFFDSGKLLAYTNVMLYKLLDMSLNWDTRFKEMNMKPWILYRLRQIEAENANSVDF